MGFSNRIASLIGLDQVDLASNVCLIAKIKSLLETGFETTLVIPDSLTRLVDINLP